MNFVKKLTGIYKKASPALQKRLSSIAIFLLLFNGAIWLYTLFISQRFPVILGLVTLAYGLGLRHAVDADHIAIIDNTTRKLMRDKQRPVGVGFFFSLGHSTIVILLTLLVTYFATFAKHNLSTFKDAGTIIGTSLSSFFLLLIGIINFVILIDIFKMWRKITKRKEHHQDFSAEEHLNKIGILARILKPFLKTVSRSWNMYFIGFLFGLGFDTASEIGLLSISAATTSHMSLGNIILLPLAFTAGMSLIDTFDGILMLGAYGWAYIKPIRKLYYNMNITFISVIIALFIGSIEALQVIFLEFRLSGGFFDVIKQVSFGNLGYIIIGIFLFSWLFSVIIYKFKEYDKLDILN